MAEPFPTFALDDGARGIWLSGPCGFCRRIAYLFVNRSGVTRCSHCDHQHTHHAAPKEQS